MRTSPAVGIKNANATKAITALDRRDLTVGATPTDSLCNPFDIGDTNDEVPANCMGWETDVRTSWFDWGQLHLEKRDVLPYVKEFLKDTGSGRSPPIARAAPPVAPSRAIGTPAALARCITRSESFAVTT